MANVKITELTAATTLDGDDVFPVVDVSGDTTNKVSVTDLLRNVPDGTAAAPSIANTGDQDTGILFPAADTVAISTGGTQRFSVDGSGDVSISGSLTVSGTTTTIESTTLTVDDKNIELGTVATPTDTTADGGGITLKGATDKTINWVQSTGCWTFNQPMNFNDHVRIDSSGTVLVGATAQQYSASKLEVADSDNAILYLYNTDVSASGAVTLAFGPSNSITGSQIRCIASEDFSTSANRTAGLAFETRQDGTLAERLRIDSSGNVGIGTTTAAPANGGGMSINGGSITRIDLRNSTTGDATGDGTSLQLNGNNFTIENRESGYVAVSTSLTERMRIDSSGNVGIGDTAPSEKLNVAGNVMLEGGDQYLYLTNAGTGNSGIYVRGNTSGSYLRSHSTGIFTWEVTGSEKMRIDSSGNVGIGQSSPASALHVSGTSVARLQLSTDSTGHTATDGVRIQVDSGNNFELIQRESANIEVFIAGTERLRIDSSGNVGIGTSSPAAKLELRDNSQALLSWGDTAAIGSLSFDGSSQPVVRALSGKSLVFQTNGGNERMRIDSSGNVGIGTTSPSSPLHLKNSNANFRIESTSTTGASVIQFGDPDDIDVGSLRYEHNGNSLRFITNASERLRIDSSGRVGIGTSSLNTNTVLSVHKGDSSESQMRFTNSTTGEAGNNGFLVGIDSSEGGRLFVQENNYLRFGTNNTERMRITSGGDLLFGKTGDNFGTAGAKQKSTGALELTADGAFGLAINRLTDDGELVRFYQATTQEGSITVSGTTVSYNGAHLSRWSQLASGAERTEILRGSVLSNLDEMCEWGDENNEQLNRMQVSDVEGDVNVAGVFQAWDDDDDTYTNDFYCAMTGDFIIRIAQGTTVTRGDLLMSAGDGTAKPQDDDIVRSKTIAKVTSTTVSATYADGSYCVPCVLMAC